MGTTKTIFRSSHFIFSLAELSAATEQRPVKINIFASGYNMPYKQSNMAADNLTGSYIV